jgi:hypothetical protein
MLDLFEPPEYVRVDGARERSMQAGQGRTDRGYLQEVWLHGQPGLSGRLLLGGAGYLQPVSRKNIEGNNMKKHDLVIQEVVSLDNGEVLAYYSLGHQDAVGFIRAVVQHDEDAVVDESVAIDEEVRHEYWRKVKAEGCECDYKFIAAKKGRGAFAVTCFDLETWDRGQNKQGTLNTES